MGGRATHRQLARARVLAARAAVLATATDVLMRDTRRNAVSTEDLRAARALCDDAGQRLERWARTNE
jgi:hypothetical protein